MLINSIKCPKCGDIIYSRSHHDFHWCSCGNTAIDGGFDYVKISAKEGLNEIKVKQIEVNATKQELYNDWNKGKNKFGLIKKYKLDIL